MDSPVSALVDNLKLELLKCLIGFHLQVYYFVMAQNFFSKSE